MAPPATPGTRDPGQTGDRTAPSASLDDRSGTAKVMLVGDVGTRVVVDGKPRGACPVSLSLDPGQHVLQFVFDPTGESRGQPISVKPGERVKVVAQFLGANPTIKVQR